MIFPFVITYKKKYDPNENSDSVLIQKFSKEIKKLKVDNIEVKEHQLNYTNGLFNGQGRTHVLAPIDSGAISVDSIEKTITFQFSTMRTLYITSAISVLVGVFAQDKLIGFGLFFWLYGLNVAISAYRLPYLITQLMKVLK